MNKGFTPLDLLTEFPWNPRGIRLPLLVSTGTQAPATLELPVTGVLTEVHATQEARLTEGLTLQEPLTDSLDIFTEFL